MAGGRYQERAVCLACMMEGVLSPAQRTSEGIETDWYECAQGHSTGVDWSRAPELRPPAPHLTGLVQREALVPRASVTAEALTERVRAALPAGDHLVQAEMFPWPRPGLAVATLKVWVREPVAAVLRDAVEAACESALAER